MSQSTAYERFRALHETGCFLMPNAWDGASSVLLAAAGFQAIATSSAAIAFSLGRQDGARAVSLVDSVANGTLMANLTGLPVNGDLEDGYGPSPDDCAATVRAAIAGQPSFVADDREMRRSGMSYTVDTLLDLRREYPERSLCLLLGMDAFLGVPHWHRWREIFDLAHVVVAHRPGWKAPVTGPLGEVMVDRGTGSIRELHVSSAGRIFVHAVTQLEISSTDLRSLIHGNRDLRYLVPEPVRDLIVSSGCYARPQR